MNVEITPISTGSVSVRNHNLGLERTYRLSTAGEAICVSTSGTKVGVTKNNLNNMDFEALKHLKKEAAENGRAQKAA